MAAVGVLGAAAPSDPEVGRGTAGAAGAAGAGGGIAAGGGLVAVGVLGPEAGAVGAGAGAELLWRTRVQGAGSGGCMPRNRNRPVASEKKSCEINEVLRLRPL